MKTFPAFLVSVLITSTVFASSGGAPAGRAGDPPGNSNCTACHSGTVNSGSGTLGLTPLSQYTPNETYDLTITLTDDGQLRWGFQLIPKDDNADPQGTLIVTDDTNTRLNSGYLTHTSTGTFQGSTDGGEWSFQWTAPAAGTGPVTFFLAGNAADNNRQTSGDNIYTISITVPENTTTTPEAPPVPVSPVLTNVWPNPFNAQTTVSVDLPFTTETHVVIVDILGRKVTTLHNGTLKKGTHRFLWNAHLVPNGRYFVHTHTAKQTHINAITLIK